MLWQSVKSPSPLVFSQSEEFPLVLMQAVCEIPPGAQVVCTRCTGSLQNIHLTGFLRVGGVLSICHVLLTTLTILAGIFAAQLAYFSLYILQEVLMESDSLGNM